MQISTQIIQQLKHIFEEKIPFNKLLKMQIVSLDHQNAKIRIDMREELVGNYIHGILHGGVISSILDVTGGLTAFTGLIQRMTHLTDEEKLIKLSKYGTVDLRVDYLRPGRGKYFEATGTILRTGNKIAVTRMELYNDENTLIAVGTGTYLSS